MINIYFHALMTCSILLDNLQLQHLVAGNGEVGQCEYRVLVPPLPSRLPVVAYAEYFERRLLLHRALCELSVCDDETPRIYFEGDVRVVRDIGVNIYRVVVDIDVLLFDFDAVLFRADVLRVRAVLTVYVAHHPLHRRGPLAPHFAQQYTSLRGRSRRLREYSSAPCDWGFCAARSTVERTWFSA